MSKYKKGDLAKNFIILLLLALFSCKEKKAEFDERNLFFEITNEIDASSMKYALTAPRSIMKMNIFNRSEQSIYILCLDTLMLDFSPNFTSKEHKYFSSQSSPFHIPKTHLMFLPRKSKISLYTFQHPEQLGYAERIRFSYSMDTVFYKKVVNKSIPYPHYSDSLFKKDTILKRRQLLFIKNKQNIFEYKGIGKDIESYKDTTLIFPFPKL